MPITATYRLQMHGAFTFDDAGEIVDYLSELGISHVYYSPYLQATAGSTHGYDVVDHNRVNEELGGEDAHRDMCEALGRAGLGQVLDVVPNHMAIGSGDNAWWWDVLENGPSSRYAHWFDVEWDPPEKRLQNMVLVPILGDHYGRVLEAGEIQLARDRGRIVVRYFDNVYPLSPRSTPKILGEAAVRCGSDELAFLSDSYAALPLATATDAVSVGRRHRDKEVLARMLADMCSGEPAVAAAIDQVLHELNHDHDALDTILSDQNYRLAFWRTARRELGYRRFFDINTLVGLRMEDERVFRETHRRTLEWLRDGVLDGIRIDHPDGLRDPEEYFQRLRAAAPKAWILGEKILEPGERMRESWPIDGTTGYDFLFRASNVLVDPRGEEPLTRFYCEFTKRSVDYHKTLRKRKDQILREVLGSDVNRLTADFMQVTESHRRFRDFTRHDIHNAIREIIICFPVYRTYVRPGVAVHEDDRRYIDMAVDEAKERRVDVPADLFDFLRSVLLAEVDGAREAEFVARFQQITGPAMAKGAEDTSFYVFNRLSSLNEVGGDPGQWGITIEEFHRLNAEAQAKWPTAMLATSTHDTKRSEDVRVRIHLLAEMPERWINTVEAWSAHCEQHRQNDLPDRNMEYLMYQTLVGAWPITQERMSNYLEKASREAKTHTSWTDPNDTYDKGLQEFVKAVFADADFLRKVEEFVSGLLGPARVYSLAQTLLKLTSPGVPDLYQGTELWDLSLVDPDNRRPVDYGLRRRLLAEMKGLRVEDVVARAGEGLPKLWLVHHALQLRKRRPELFGRESSYAPVDGGEHLVAFVRGDGAMTVMPRLVMSLGDWGDTVIDVPNGSWVNVLTTDEVRGGSVRVGDLLRRFPVALLERK